MLNQTVACINIPLVVVTFKTSAFFFGRQRARKGTGVDDMQRHVEYIGDALQKFKKQKDIPFQIGVGCGYPIVCGNQ
jgi:hypothetical protein